MRAVVIFAVLCFVVSCGNEASEGFNLPESCDSKCFVANDMNSLRDAIVNSSAQFSNCICLESGLTKGDITISKSLNIIGKSDGGSRLERLVISKAQNVNISNVAFSGVAAADAAVNIYESSVKLQNVTISNISAGSLYGGRGLIISGKKSIVELSGVNIDNTDGTGLLINGSHDVTVRNSKVSDCGFAGIWAQNQELSNGKLTIENSSFINNAAVGVQILGNSMLSVDKSIINGIDPREITQNFVSDAIVVKNTLMSEVENSVIIKDTTLDNFERSGIIFDGENGYSITGVTIENLNIISKKGQFGVVVQNGFEPDNFRDGISGNPFSQNDLNLENPLFIITAVQTAE
ncbi:MAG TPA: right-handed parallel beta-helix repeat-containing protein [bacterium]|nr:right-handed parallel beta-helix repeat-containing protein [bacterium]HPS30517.1 right-handed parallel beta-helix repeat-containing protein [bacterium]